MTEQTDTNGHRQVDRAARGLLWFRVDEGRAVVHRLETLRRRSTLGLWSPRRACTDVECRQRQSGARWVVVDLVRIRATSASLPVWWKSQPGHLPARMVVFHAERTVDVTLIRSARRGRASVSVTRG